MDDEMKVNKKRGIPMSNGLPNHSLTKIPLNARQIPKNPIFSHLFLFLRCLPLLYKGDDILYI